MGKDKNPRRVAENEALAKAKMLKTSPQKLNLVAAMIRGKKVREGAADLTFSKKRIAQDVKKCLQSAIANAENNHNLDVDELVVAEAWVGKNLVMKRFRPRARGRIGKIVQAVLDRTHHQGPPGRGASVMGHKVNPIGMRLGQPDLGQPLVRRHEGIRQPAARGPQAARTLREEAKQAGVSKIIIERPHRKPR
jgi:large subunit ribosomal protein L22